jgi:amino acid transporter
MQNERDFSDQIRFSRSLNPWQAIVRGLGTIVPVAVFILLNESVTTAGPLAPLSLLMTGLLMMVNLLGYVELTATVPRPGGAYTVIHEAQAGWLAFLTGWIATLSGLGVCTLLAQGFAVQVTVLLNDHLGLALPIWPWAAGLVILLGVDNGLGRAHLRVGGLADLGGLYGAFLGQSALAGGVF